MSDAQLLPFIALSAILLTACGSEESLPETQQPVPTGSPNTNTNPPVPVDLSALKLLADQDYREVLRLLERMPLVERLRTVEALQDYWLAHPLPGTLTVFPLTGSHLIDSVDFDPETFELIFTASSNQPGVLSYHLWHGLPPSGTLYPDEMKRVPIVVRESLSPNTSVLDVALTVSDAAENVEVLNLRLPLPRLELTEDEMTVRAKHVYDGRELDLPVELETRAVEAEGLLRPALSGEDVAEDGEQRFDFVREPRDSPRARGLFTVNTRFWQEQLLPFELNDEPAIADWSYDHAAAQLTVKLADAALAGTEVSLSVLGGEEVAGTNVDARTMVFSLPDLTGPYTAELRAIHPQTLSEESYVIGLGSSGFGLPRDTLRAWFAEPQVRVGQPVRVTVASGLTEHWFSFMNGVRISAPTDSGFAYVPRSFDVGAAGGAREEGDGGWVLQSPTAGFLLAPDSFIVPREERGGIVAYDFNVTPIHGGTERFFEGELFNLEATFSQPGTYTLEFEAQDHQTDRTYYSDSTTIPNRHWGDLANDHPAATIEVLP